MSGFSGAVRTIDELREVIPPPEEPAVRKEIGRLDEHCRTFIAHSPFLVMATADDEGRCDASPKGGPPGFVKVLDDRRLAIPDAPGNRRLDSHSNILATGRGALIFFVPGYGETLRIEGRLTISRDEHLRDALVVDGKVPKLAIGMDVELAYLHCARALKRSGLWDPEKWPDTTDMPRAGRIFQDHMKLPYVTEEMAEHHLSESYQPANLW